MLDRITPVILTRNEEDNIGRCLEQLTWASEVLVIDSVSRDRTTEIARRFANVRMVERPFDSLSAQWTFGLEQARTPWILALDADHIATKALIEELSALQPGPEIAAYEIAFRYAIHGRLLRASIYPPKVAILCRDRCSFYQDGHTQRVHANGAVVPLTNQMIHDDRKNFRRFIERQKVYMRDEAKKIVSTNPNALNTASRIRRMRVIAPVLVPLYTLFARGTLFDGRAGWWYAWERMVAELILSRELFRRSPESPGP